MKKILFSAILLSATVFINSAFAIDEFEYFIKTDGKRGVIGVQHFKGAPRPKELEKSELVTRHKFKSITKDVKIRGVDFKARFIGGWLYLSYESPNAGNISSTFLADAANFKEGVLENLLMEIAPVSCALLKQAEDEILQNPYAGRSVKGGIPQADHFIPTATNADRTDKFVASLAYVYGGTLSNTDTTTTYVHGPHTVFSYWDKMLSTASEEGYLTGKFRDSDDNETANSHLRLTSFESWFK